VKTETPHQTVAVQTRGLARNEMWVLSYDLYPVRVKGKFLEEGGRPDDPILPEADWTLTQQKDGLKLERVK
jgi:hypothetical protein